MQQKTNLQTDEKEHRTPNSGFAKKRVHWLIEHSTSHQILWYVNSLVLRNPLLRKAEKRYILCWATRHAHTTNKCLNLK